MATRRRQVVWSRSAREDLHKAIAFVAQDSPEAGLRLLDRILEAASSLATLSERGRNIGEFADRTIRALTQQPAVPHCAV
jgi:plasmid stabilization system protein ParE